MPPRRSSRSTRASVEPITAEETQTATKRKRSQAPEDEPASKPPSRARSASARPSSKRTSTRSRGSLPEVQEDEDEEGSDSPPVKKARPSLEPEKESDFEEEKPKGRRAASVPRAKPSSTASKTGASSSRPARTSRKTAAQPVMEEDEDEAEEDVKPTRRASRGKSKEKASSSKRTPVQDDDEDMAVSEEEEEEPAPKAKKGRASSAKPKPAKKTTSRKVPAVTIEDSDEEDRAPEEQPPPPEQSTSTAPPPTQPKQEEESDEDLEEPASLLEPPPLPTPSQAPRVPEEPAGPKARLVIHKMVLINFKSYAGKQEIGPFHKSFSSIVGPNGSGKSNTIDALLFVFGYRASKMRQGKLSELIHNSANFPDLQECSVEVHFREIMDLPGPDAFEVVPGSSLVVTRLAFKNNSSRYTINGRSSTFKEVQTLLKEKGIDLDHNRFLILQGEVESIAQMKPKAVTEHDEGLLEYLEDIIGTSQYKEPIDEALVEMEKLQEERVVKLNRLRIVEKEKAALEQQKREAEDYLRLKNDHVRAQSRYWQWLLWKCFQAEDAFAVDKAKFEKTLADETSRYQDDITHLEAMKAHYTQRETAYQEISKAAQAALKDLAAQEKDEVGLQERRKHGVTKQKKLKKSVQEDDKNRAQALRDIEDNAERMETKKEEADELEASLVKEEKTLENIRDSLKDKTQKFHDQIEVKQKELQPWMAQINAKQSAINVASSERDALKKKAEDAEARRQEAEQNLQELKGDHEVKVKELSKLGDNKKGVQRQLAQAEQNLQVCQRTVDECRSKAAQSRSKVDEAKASQAENKSQNRVLDSLKKLQDSGRISGFHGRLGALGTIPDKYDVAVSTAAGALHNMVVDRVEQGQQCIEYLRGQNIGRATFMVLEKLGNMPGMAKPYKIPEDAPRLFDLIKPKDPRFAPAFYKAIGDTLVATDMDQANRIAFGGGKRWRVVTLGGQLIDTSGTMSGGGSQPAKGAMSSKLAAEAVRPEVLRSYEQECQNAAARLEEALQALRAAEEEVERLRNSGPQLEMAYQKLELDIENSKRRIQDAEKRWQEVRSQSKPNANDAARIATLEEEIATTEEELESLRAKSGTIEAAIKDLEKKILDVGGAKLLTQKSKVEGIKLHISLANEEITKAEVAKAKAEKDAAKLETTLATNKAALEEIAAELGELDEQLAEVQGYIEDIRGKVETAQAAAESSRDDLEALKKELDAKDQEIEAFRQKELEIKQKLADIDKDMEDNNKIISHLQAQHDDLRLEEIDDEDEEEEEEEAAGSGSAETTEGQKSHAMETDVKAEPEEHAGPTPKKKEKQSSTELQIYGEHELSRFKKRELQADVELLDEQIQNAKPDLTVLKEYKRREEEFLKRATDLDHVTEQRDAQKAKYDGLRKQRLDEFMAGFNLISLKLKEMYQMITLGGNAELELVDSMDPFSEGIIFSVMPPKKSWKNISNLSGGEKTLSSLALVFALHVFKPTPLYFMDEIDAALDFRNVSIVANYIKDRTKNAQFIIISLRNDMFELSHRLIGIYKTANVTKSVSIDNHSLTARAPATVPAPLVPPSAAAA